MPKDLTVSLLLDFYGDILPDGQREAMDMFFNGDLSLSEISEITGLTRQGARERIVRGEKTVRELEEKLGLASRFSEIREITSEINEKLKTLSAEHGVDVSSLLTLTERLLD
ncbi:MAG: DNA-binding protein [Clostridia bacterium]|nr:DNA-binding protein [Clostridia bacterium]MBR5767398.1 DNA-binding protein [Clostridia bacterium]